MGFQNGEGMQRGWEGMFLNWLEEVHHLIWDQNEDQEGHLGKVVVASLCFCNGGPYGIVHHN